MNLPERFPADRLKEEPRLATDQRFPSNYVIAVRTTHSDMEGKGAKALRFRARTLTTVLAALIAGSCGVFPLPQCAGWNTSEFFQAADTEVVGRCLAFGAKPDAVDADGKTPLHFVAELSDENGLVGMFVASGADPNARDVQGFAPIHSAAIGNASPAMIDALIDAGADIDARAGRFNENALHMAAGLSGTKRSSPR